MFWLYLLCTFTTLDICFSMFSYIMWKSTYWFNKCFIINHWNMKSKKKTINKDWKYQSIKFIYEMFYDCNFTQYKNLYGKCKQKCVNYAIHYLRHIFSHQIGLFSFSIVCVFPTGYHAKPSIIECAKHIQKDLSIHTNHETNAKLYNRPSLKFSVSIFQSWHLMCLAFSTFSFWVYLGVHRKRNKHFVTCICS